MEDISLHVLDIVENSLRANARNIEIILVERREEKLLQLTIKDDGEGMDRKTAERACDPFFTTKSGKRVGLGLSLLRQAATDTGGELRLAPRPGGGTVLSADFHTDHPDMKPLGDMVATMSALVSTNPSVRFVCDCRAGNCDFHFDSESKEPHG